MGSTALIRRKQLEIAEDEKGLELVTDMIQQKIKNQADFLKKQTVFICFLFVRRISGI